MVGVTVRDLRHRSDELVDRVAAGERLLVTRVGRAVATLAPLPRRPLTPAELLVRWRSLPAIDLAALRSDVRGLADSEL